MKNIFSILILISLLVICSAAQVTQQWVSIYDGPAGSIDIPRDMIIDEDGNSYVTGSSWGNYPDITTIKYNTNGVQQWIARYDGSSHYIDDAFKIKMDKSGNIYVCGFSRNGVTSVSNTCLIKYSSSGSQQWIQTIDNSAAYDMALDTSGNIYITGYIDSNAAVSKYNPQGVLQWTQKYKGTGICPNPALIYNSGSCMEIDKQDNIYIMADIWNLNTNRDIGILKYNSSGQQQWVTIWNDVLNLDDETGEMTLDNDRNICVTGIAYGQSSKCGYVTIKLNQAGQILWYRDIQPPTNQYNYPSGIVTDRYKNIYIIGYGALVPTIEYGAFIRKYNKNGIEQWNKMYHDSINTNDFPSSIVTGRHNTIYISECVTTGTGSNMHSRRILKKLNSNGDELWKVKYYGPDYGSGSTSDVIKFDGDNNIYIAGTNNAGNHKENYETMKYYERSYTVSGTVKYQDNNAPITSGNVKALYYDKNNAQVIVVDSVQIQSNGTYTLTHVQTDSLFIMVYQNDDEEQFVPTYYPSTIDWKQAVKIYPIQNLTGIDIAAYRINNNSNIFSINGFTYSVNQNDFPVNDAIIYLKIGNEYKNFGLSKWNGAYTVTKLSPGSYNLIAQRIGFNSINLNVEITNSSIYNLLIDFLVPIGISGNPIAVPEEFKLHQNYPNPFNPSTIINYQLPINSFVKIAVYDLLGREVEVLINEKQNAGSYNIEWNASDKPSGVYFYRLTTDNFTVTKKMILLK